MNEIEEILYNVIKEILPNFDAENICRVHQAFGQPSFSNSEDRIFFDVVETDADIAKELYFEERFDTEKDVIKRTHKKTITVNVKFVIYGPNAYNNSLLVRDGFYREAIRKTLRENGLFIVPYHRPVLFFPEQMNGGWFQRYDFEETFNRLWTSDPEDLDYIEQTNIILEGEQ